MNRTFNTICSAFFIALSLSLPASAYWDVHGFRGRNWGYGSYYQTRWNYSNYYFEYYGNQPYSYSDVEGDYSY